MRYAGLWVCAVFLLAFGLAGCVDGVNGSVNVAAGSTSTSDASTVNGAVNIGANARAGDADTVNGSINVAEGAHIGEATTVNGSITLAGKSVAKSATTVNGDVSLESGASVSGDITTVNGHLELAPGASVGADVSNVNGAISINGAHVGGGVATVNADITVSGKALIEGGIKVEKSESGGILHVDFDRGNVPRIVIGPGATVNGPLVFERKVALYVRDLAHVAGPITGAQAVPFSGAEPPGS